MKHQEYLKIIEKEIHRINKEIDLKILRGETYVREARDHKLLVRKMRHHTRSNFFNRFFPTVFQF